MYSSRSNTLSTREFDRKTNLESTEKIEKEAIIEVELKRKHNSSSSNDAS